MYRKRTDMILELTTEWTDEYIRLRSEALRLHPDSFGSGPDYKHSRETTFQRLEAKHEEDFILAWKEGERLEAMLGFKRNQGIKHHHRSEIWGVYVSEAYRRKGIAQALFEECFSRASKMEGLKKILLGASHINTGSIKLYERLGFEEYAREPARMIWQGQELDEVYM
ncbi:MAG: GNAT family N-acetyltransferase, partial [Bacteroidota bacterium]